MTLGVSPPCGYCLKASMTGPVLFCLVVGPAPHLWIADQVRNDGTMLGHRFHPHLSPLPSRERGFCRLVWLVFTLTFDSSPIKGEGDSVGWCCIVVAPHHTPPLWIADQVRNDMCDAST